MINPSNPFSLSGKTILITGASSGIGRATAEICAREGARLILLARNEERLQSVCSSLEGEGHQYFSIDLTMPDAISKLSAVLPPLDGIVHSAGVGLTLPFKFTNESELNRVMDINFKIPVLLTSHLLKTKLIKPAASIVYIASVDGPVTGHVGNSIYSASKGALVGMAKSQAVELAARGIRVNCVSPARVETPHIQRDNITDQQIEANKRLYPLRRYARPDEIAYYILYLLSDTSSFTTGSNLIIDGGLTLI